MGIKKLDSKLMKEQRTQFDKFKSRIKNNPILASLMVLGMVIIALSSFTDAAKNLLDLVISETRPDINGEWTAEVTYPWKKVSYDEAFSFDGNDNEVHGAVSYLENKQIILDGKIIENRIEFKTKTTENSPDWENNILKLATHHYRGIVLEKEIKFVMETYGGYSSDSPIEFIAKRVPNKAN
ncbi:MAG: hypothetical protein V3U75_14205 [Methylococcaceae bacterium]